MNITIKISVATVLHFIQKYRSLEKASLQEGYVLIRKLELHHSQIQHLCDQWRWKKKNFGEFFLNLSYRTQIGILHLWNIIDTADQEYLLVDEIKDPAVYLFGDPPATVKALHELMIFFNNHGIESFEERTSLDRNNNDVTVPGLTLNVLPHPKKRYGNSSNWGDYIEALEDPDFVLRQILYDRF
jgi:hypothetical protein